MSSEHIAALCDVDRNALDKAAADYPQARKEVDFRRLFDRPGEFDAVVVSTTEHTHAFATLPALQLKKHVYCEKPLAHNVQQTRIIREAAARAGVATQMGTQVHASDNYRRVVELVQAGAIGKVTECHVWVARAWGWHASEAEATEHKDIVFVRIARPRPTPFPPASTGTLARAGSRPPLQQRLPARAQVVPLVGFRQRDDERPGQPLDRPALLGAEAARTGHHRGERTAAASPDRSRVDAGEVRVQGLGRPARAGPHLVPGHRKPDIWTRGEIPQWPSGVLFVGERGMLLADYRQHVLLFDERTKEFARPPESIPKSVGHHQEWIDACKTGSPTTCHFAYAGWLTEANHLGNVAYRVGKKLEWDAEEMRATNAPEAEPFLTRAHRPGWKLA